jgi:uncharacterized membrane protein
MTRFSKPPFHTLLFALYPVLALYAYNIREVSSSVIWRPLLILLIGAILLLGVLRLLIRDWSKAAFVSTITLFIFFTYGRLYDYLKTTPLAAMNIVRHRYLVFLFILLLVLVGWFVLKHIRDIKPITGILNIIATLLVIFPAILVVSYSIKSAISAKAASAITPANDLVSIPQQGKKPDVYYIILDSYTRSDVYKTELGFDNSDFIRQLEELGFYVADCSRSNYDNTMNSLASSLNMSYLPELYSYGASQGISPDYIWALIKPSTVRRNFESLGYKTVAFDTPFKWTTVDDVDIFLERDQDAFGIQFINPFEQMLMDSTMLSVFSDYQRKLNRDKYFGAPHPKANYIGQEEFILDQLPKLVKIADPTFTFAHINIPHAPFVFSPKGYLIDRGGATDPGSNEAQFPLGYIHGTEYINARILAIIQELLTESTIPPIIILQGDHGFWEAPYYYAPILNAYFLPGIHISKFYSSISPVNSFRLVFNEYFNGNYDLLPDISYKITDLSNPIPEIYPDCQ